VAISGPRTRGTWLPILALMAPFTWPPGTAGTEEVFGGNPFGYVALFVSGLVNIVFPSPLLKFTRYRRAFAAADRVLPLIPFSWLVFVLLPVFPREGRPLVAGMLLALFPGDRRSTRRQLERPRISALLPPARHSHSKHA
jgi:hypothetical protein